MKRYYLVFIISIFLFLNGCDYIEADNEAKVDITGSINRIYMMENYGYDEAYHCISREYTGREMLILVDYDNCLLTEMVRTYVNKTGTETGNITESYDFYVVDDNTIRTVDTSENSGTEYRFLINENGERVIEDSYYTYEKMDIADALSMAREKYHFDFTDNEEAYRKLTTPSGINAASEVKRSDFFGTYIGDAKSILILNQDGSLEYYFVEWNDTLSENWELRYNSVEWKSQKFGGMICGKLDSETGEMNLIQGASSILPYWDDEKYHKLNSDQSFLSVEECQRLITTNLSVIE